MIAGRGVGVPSDLKCLKDFWEILKCLCKKEKFGEILKSLVKKRKEKRRMREN